MNEDEEIREKPDAEDLEWMSKLRRQLVQLKLKHGRRKRSPLKFVEAYEELERDLGEYSSCLPVRTLVEQMKKELGWLKNDYELKVIPAEEQAKRNELWDSIYRPLPRILEGGRADGNR